jgi:hypothetical protein
MRYLVALLAVMLAACTPSLDPLYTDRDIFFDPALLGTWRDADPNAMDHPSRFVAMRGGANAYRVLIADGGGTAGFTANLSRIGDHRFFDLYPDEPSVPNDLYGGHLIRTHSFGRLSLEGDRVRLAMLDPEWFQTDAGRQSSLPRRMLRKTLLLTASTAQLREFALQHPQDGPFAKGEVWIREPETASER